MRTLAIGDIHGCLTALTTLVQFAKVTEDDLLITLGDYVNRGPDSKGVLDWLIARKATGSLVALKGNHEAMMLGARSSTAFLSTFVKVGGIQTLKSYSRTNEIGTVEDVPESHWDFLQNDLKRYYETENHFFVHANAYPEMPLASQPDFMLLWESYNDPPAHESGKRMICGHSSQKNGLPVFNDNAVCIDTWAHGSGWLSCVDVDSNFIWQANQQGETRKFFLGDDPDLRT